MAQTDFTMRQLLEAGVHFGHQTHLWNPKMGSYIFGVRNGIHILDLSQTVPLLHQALLMVSDVVAKGGRVLFVGTKRQASDVVSEAARSCAQYYINHRWMGGTLTNWKTVSNSIRRLKKLDEMLDGEAQGFTKKERLQLQREREKLERALGGIKDMGGRPDLLFVIDTNREAIAIAEARKLGIPVIAIADSNSDPDVADFSVPGNDDAGRAVTLYCDLVARAALEGIEKAHVGSGHDIGAAVDPVAEAILEGETIAEEANGAAVETSPEEAPAETVADLGETGFEKLSAPKGDADDLKRVPGIGPVVEQKLNQMGVYHFWQIAAFSEADAKKVDDALDFGGQVMRDNWVAEAAKLTESGN